MKFRKITSFILVVVLVLLLTYAVAELERRKSIPDEIRTDPNNIPTSISPTITTPTLITPTPSLQSVKIIEPSVYQAQNGTITILYNAEGMFITQDTEQSSPSTDVLLSGTSDANFIHIIAEDNTHPSFVIQDLNLDASNTDQAPILVTIEENSSVTLEIDGTNNLLGGDHRAAIEKHGYGTLIITDTTGVPGVINAQGGDGGAGIGSGSRFDCEGISIKGGTIYAKGGAFAAGIGGGSHGSGYSITVSGDAFVHAEGGKYGSGIGGGSYGNGQKILFTDNCLVNSIASYTGSGIGGGAYGRGDEIYASESAKITAIGGLRTSEYYAGANIGNGGSDSSNGTSFSVDLSGLFSSGNVNGVVGVIPASNNVHT